MKLTFLYQPVEDLAAAAAFHRDLLGLEEAWREGDDTIAFWLPDRSAQIMIATSPLPPGPMFLVENLDAWTADHPSIETTVEKSDIPGGAVAGFAAPGGNTFYVFDQPDA
jgi:catechol 2,3-dioxygenase-like lactoylglutathione lyase family enzyme